RVHSGGVATAGSTRVSAGQRWRSQWRYAPYTSSWRSTETTTDPGGTRTAGENPCRLQSGDPKDTQSESHRSLGRRTAIAHCLSAETLRFGIKKEAAIVFCCSGRQRIGAHVCLVRGRAGPAISGQVAQQG